MKRFLGKALLRLAGWRVVGESPTVGCVVVCAPHTSNVDYLLMLMVSWQCGFTLSWLGKTELFKPPLGWFMRATGGIAVDRKASNGLVGQLVAEFKRDPQLILAIPAEGTRSRTDHWKSGFYRIAEQAGVPYVLAFIDSSTKTTGFGPFVEPSGNLTADMDIARAFYADKVGLKPENFGEIRLREEDADTDA